MQDLILNLISCHISSYLCSIENKLYHSMNCNLFCKWINWKQNILKGCLVDLQTLPRLSPSTIYVVMISESLSLRTQSSDNGMIQGHPIGSGLKRWSLGQQSYFIVELDLLLTSAYLSVASGLLLSWKLWNKSAVVQNWNWHNIEKSLPLLNLGQTLMLRLRHYSIEVRIILS